MRCCFSLTDAVRNKSRLLVGAFLSTPKAVTLADLISAFLLAAELGHVDIIKTLSTSDVYVRRLCDKHAKTALELAVNHNQPETAKLLLEVSFWTAHMQQIIW